MKCSAIRIGQLNKRIEIINQTGSTRQAGGIIAESWSVSIKSWAMIKTKRMNPLLEAQNIENQTTHEITIPINDFISTKSRIRYNGRFFFVRNYYNLDENDQYYKIEATENSKAKVTVA
jgi:SPP1 family predicted phage head-tail adaptor